MRTPISPALVRAAMKYPLFDGPALRDHIRAVAAEMRERAGVLDAAVASAQLEPAWHMSEHARHLRLLADELEGVE